MSSIPDVTGMKMSAAIELLDAAGVSYTAEEIRPHGVRIKENENGKEGVMRVVRQRCTSENTLILSVCSICK